MTSIGVNSGTAHLSDADFIAAFETCALPNTQFHHADHVRLTWLYVRQLGEAAAAKKVIDGIQRYVAFNGATRKFNYTQTRAWVRLVAHACKQSAENVTFAEFVAAYLKLFDRGALAAHYSKQLLESDDARSAWLEPDLLPLP
jgi:hypothetical protein